jgi:hypothetical protein
MLDQPRTLEPPRRQLDLGGGDIDVGGFIGGAVGNLLTDVVSGTLSNVAGNLITDLLIKAGVPPGLLGQGGGGIDLSGLLGQVSSLAGGGPSYGLDIERALGFLRSPTVPDVGGIGGGFLTTGPYLGEAGKVAGALLKSKKIKIQNLLTGGGKSVISDIFEGRVNLGLTT